jgi:hypothetical protein
MNVLDASRPGYESYLLHRVGRKRDGAPPRRTRRRVRSIYECRATTTPVK